MQGGVSIKISYEGFAADQNYLDLYDAAHALISFQRSLALTTHLVLNNEIITQAPSLKGARILAHPVKEGSWELVATIVAGAWVIGTAPKDTPLGHLVYSVYDYMLQKTLGVKVDFNKSIREAYLEQKEKDKEIRVIEESKVESLIEKTGVAIREMHRPIYKTQTARSAKITAIIGSTTKHIGTDLTVQTYEHLRDIHHGADVETFYGIVTSYNSNTYKGRIYIPEINRPIVFELHESARNTDVYNIITTSLKAHALKKTSDVGALIQIGAIKNLTNSDSLKSLTVFEVAV